MKRPVLLLFRIVCSAGLAMPTVLFAETSVLQGSSAEMSCAEQWANRLGPLATGTAASGAKTPAADARVPFSFALGSQESRAFLPSWTVMSGAEEASSSSLRRSVSWKDPKTGLEVVVEMVRFRDFPAVEWVVRFKNHGTADTPILEQILPLDLRISASSAGGQTPVLHYAKGALCCLDDFAPVSTPLAPGTELQLQPGGGRSSSEVLPFFNLDRGNQGLVLGVGWTGEWAVKVRADDASSGQAKAMIEQYLGIQKYFYGDFYPLTPYSQAGDAWLAYQLHLPDANEGIVVVLKRLASSRTRATLRLQGLSRDASYEVTQLDTAQIDKLPASRLTDLGLEIELPRQPDSAIVRYHWRGVQ